MEDGSTRAAKRPTENELSDFSRLWHDGCGKTSMNETESATQAT
jgi:hypothetical protein